MKEMQKIISVANAVVFFESYEKYTLLKIRDYKKLLEETFISIKLSEIKAEDNFLEYSGKNVLILA